MSYEDVGIEPEVLQFLVQFQNMVVQEVDLYRLEEHHEQLQDLYENYWNRLTDRYFKSCPWPDIDTIEESGLHITQEFKILYKELYYRHIFARVGNQKGANANAGEFAHLNYERFRSWENYVEFFNLIINTPEVPQWSIPAQWLWDIMDEFLYQYSQYRQYRSKLQHKTDKELEFLENNDQLWMIHSVLNVMHSIVDKSMIVQSLSNIVKGQGDSNYNRSRNENQFADNQMYRYLGYFSLIGLLRFHVITGDYQLAVDSIKSNPIELLYDLEDNEWFITTHYYYGFALIMMKRYQEAIIIFQNALNFIERTNRATATQRQVSYKVDQQNRQVDQLYHLLAICVTLFPMKLDDQIETNMRSKVGEENIAKMQDGNQKVFDDMYTTVCPKFVPLGSPPLDSGKAVNFMNANLQKKVFMDEIHSQLQLPAIRRYLKLYTTMELSKLSSFLSKSQGFSTDHSTSAENATLSYLMCCKVKMGVASGENFDQTCPSTGKILNAYPNEVKEKDEVADENGPSVDFYVDGKMVHIADTKVEWTYGRSFLKLIEQYRKIEVQSCNVGKKSSE